MNRPCEYTLETKTVCGDQEDILLPSEMSSSSTSGILRALRNTNKKKRRRNSNCGPLLRKAPASPPRSIPKSKRSYHDMTILGDAIRDKTDILLMGLFIEWMLDHNRDYINNVEERTKRFAIFRANAERIHAYNTAEDCEFPYSGLNGFADKTGKERRCGIVYDEPDELVEPIDPDPVSELVFTPRIYHDTCNIGQAIKDDKLLMEMFEQWMFDFGRGYHSTKDKMRHFKMFKKSAERIYAHNTVPHCEFPICFNSTSDRTKNEWTLRNAGKEYPWSYPSSH